MSKNNIRQFPGNPGGKNGFRPPMAGKKSPVMSNPNIPNPANVSNPKLIELMKNYRYEKSNEKLNELITHLVTCVIMIPAIMKENNQPAPKLMKTTDGEMYLGIYTDKDQVPEDEKKSVMLVMPYLVANKTAINPVDNIAGIVINPFTDNFIIKRPLLEKIEEVEQKKAEAKKAQDNAMQAIAGLGEVITDENGNKAIKMNEKQYNQFERTEYEVGYIPRHLFEEGQAFIDRLLKDKETCIDEMFEDSYKQKRMYPFLPEDFGVMPMVLSDELTVISIEMPERDIAFGNAYRLYISWNSAAKEARYFRIVQGKEKGQVLLEEITADRKIIRHGDAPYAGKELATITELIGYEG